MSGVRVVILGPVHAEIDGVPVAVPGARVRLLLARLALARGRVVPADVLIDDLWDTTPLADATNTLQALVSRLRKVVGAVERTGGGYRLVADVDVTRFEELAARGRREVAAGQHAAAIVTLDAASASWTGGALGDLPDAAFVREAAARLAELRLAAVEDRAEAALRLGRHDEVLTATGGAHPLRERSAALRIRALYGAGRQSDALAAYEKVRGALAEQLGVDPGPELRQAHLAIVRGEPVTPPTPTPGRLPAQLTGFTGRDAELALLARQLADTRLVTVVGPGGVGKTRLAVEAAARHPAHDRGRVWFVPLATATDVAGAVLGVLSATRVRPEHRAVPDQLVELIGPEPAVLVLDNCEHVVAAAAAVADQLLGRLPLLTVLATSREPLAITGEALCRLDPLAEDDAVRLFVDRARAVRPEFTPDDLVRDVCRRLDGLPLALELAAARLRSLSLDQVARRLDDRFRLLTAGSRTALPRHRTLHAVVEWSWDLLTDDERLLAGRLSLFPGGTTASAVAAVCGTGCEDVLASLVEKSFVQWDGRRYRMLETIRAFAAQRLDHAPRARFVRYFVEQAEDREPKVRSHAQLAAIRWFDEEYDNLLAALRAAVDDGEADAAARLVGALFWYWHTLRFDARADGFVAEVLAFPLPRHRRAALAAAQLMSDGADADPARIGAVIADCVDSGALARHPVLLLWAAPMAYFAGHHELARRLATMAHPDPWAAAIAAWARGVFRNDQGDWAGAAAERRRALRGFEAVGERLGLSFTLARVARDHSLSGAHDEAIGALARCVTLAAEVGWPEEISYRARLGVERLRAGDVDGAREDLTAALRQAVERGQPQLRLEPLVALADLHRRCGDPARAEELLAEAASVVHGLPGAELTAAILTAPVRTACRIGTPDARELLPLIANVGTAARDLAAPAAELLARVLAAEGDAAGAATALGMSEVVRGTFDRGDPELRELVADLTARLGEESYATAYRRGAAMPRDEALAYLHAL